VQSDPSADGEGGAARLYSSSPLVVHPFDRSSACAFLGLSQPVVIALQRSEDLQSSSVRAVTIGESAHSKVRPLTKRRETLQMIEEGMEPTPGFEPGTFSLPSKASATKPDIKITKTTFPISRFVSEHFPTGQAAGLF
jgi:hypothetical protein